MHMDGCIYTVYTAYITKLKIWNAKHRKKYKLYDYLHKTHGVRKAHGSVIGNISENQGYL